MSQLNISNQHNNIFIAIDGDDVGILLREKIIANDIQGVSALSTAIYDYFQALGSLLDMQNYKIIFCGGDSLLATGELVLPFTLFKELPSGPCTISMGIGETPEYAYLALQLAKARGKNQVVYINQMSENTVYKWHE